MTEDLQSFAPSAAHFLIATSTARRSLDSLAAVPTRFDVAIQPRLPISSTTPPTAEQEGEQRVKPFQQLHRELVRTR